MKNFRYIIFAAFLLSILAACVDIHKSDVSIRFKQDSYEATLGDLTSLNLAKELEIENTDSEPQFSSSDLEVATISKRGLLTPVSVGQTTITAAVDGRATSCKVVVTGMTAKSINLISSSLQLVAGFRQEVKAVCDPADYPMEQLEWTCSSVPEGLAKLEKVDDSTYKIICEDYVADAQISLTVNDLHSETSSSLDFTLVPSVAKITLNHVTLSREIGDEPVQLVATMEDEDGNVVEGFEHIEWTATKDESGVRPKDIVEVTESGLVSFVGRGTSTVKIKNTTSPGVYAHCNVTVTAPPVEVETITLSPSSKTIKVDEEFTIYTAVEPYDADDQELTFVSSDEEIATVTKDGKVTAIAEGEVDITVSVKNGVKAVCEVTVDNDAEEEEGEHIRVESVTLQSATKKNEVAQLETLQIIPFYGPSGATPETATWESSDENIATVDENGIVTPVILELDPDKETWVTIKHTADNQVATINIQIIRARPKEVKFTAVPPTGNIRIGDTFQYKAKVEPDLADQRIIWQCFDENGTSILNGIDYYDGTFRTGGNTKIGVGKYRIRAKAAGDESIAVYSEIEVLPVDILGATLNYTQLTMNVGASVNLEVTFNPANATFKDIKWSSSNKDIAHVENGKVFAKAVGETDITATLANGLVLTCSLTVQIDPNAPKLGDYYYTDGTWSTELVSSKVVAGVVYSIDNLTLHDSKLATDHPTCIRGAVLALTDATTADASTFKWQGWRYELNDWAQNHGFMPIKGISLIGTAQVGVNEAGKRLCGYNNTKAIKAFMASDDYDETNSDIVIHLFDADAPTSDLKNTSGWYIPSIAELTAIAQNRALLQQKIVAAGGDAFAETTYYWSSTEGNLWNQAAAMSLSNGTPDYVGERSHLKCVRYVFAF